MKRWLVIWAPVLALFGLIGEGPAPEGLLMALGVVFWAMGILVAHRTAGRGSLAGLFMLGGLFVSLFSAGMLAAMGMQDREALSLTILGLVGGLQLALDGAPLTVLLLNLTIYWVLSGLAVYTGSGSVLRALALFALGPPALTAPSALLAWVKSRRGEHWPHDLRRAERVLRWLLGLGVIGLIILVGLRGGSRDYWLGALFFTALILTGLRKA